MPTVCHLQPSGSFVVGGPKVTATYLNIDNINFYNNLQGDAGLTGRKIIVDTYGGWGAHGGGAFSGKDPTKVDRSGGYACRWIAKSLVAAGLAERVLVQVTKISYFLESRKENMHTQYAGHHAISHKSAINFSPHNTPWHLQACQLDQ